MYKRKGNRLCVKIVDCTYIDFKNMFMNPKKKKSKRKKERDVLPYISVT